MKVLPVTINQNTVKYQSRAKKAPEVNIPANIALAFGGKSQSTQVTPISKKEDPFTKSVILLELRKKIESNPALLKEEFSDLGIKTILCYTHDEYAKKFALRILDNPNFFKSKEFVDKLPKILNDFPNQKNNDNKARREVLNEIIDYIKQKPKLFENDEFCRDVGTLLYLPGECPGVTEFSAKQFMYERLEDLDLLKSGYYEKYTG